MDPIWAVGLMTGTVLDGNIDVAMLRTDGETVAEFGPWTLAPYDPAIRALLVETLDAARAWNFEGPEPEIFARAEAALTRAQAEAVRALVENAGLAMADIGVVGFHGQTVLHRAPQPGRIGDTRQLGDGALMAEMLGTRVAYDFRTADVRAGGQGAPLSAAYHAALLKDLATSDTAGPRDLDIAVAWRGAGAETVEREIVQPLERTLRGVDGVLAMAGRAHEGGGGLTLSLDRAADIALAQAQIRSALAARDALPDGAEFSVREVPRRSDGNVAVLNLGGVANITWTDGKGQVIAFDTGPANAPINDFVHGLGLGDMDRDGALALAGTVDEDRLARLLDHPYLWAPYPKSLDRFDFSANMAQGCSARDGAALLTAFTASAVGKALDLLPRRPERLIVCGGGRRNPAIMAALATRAGIVAEPAEAVGWRGDAIEAECFALLAVRTLRSLPISFPTTTGVAEPMTGGTLAG